MLLVIDFELNSNPNQQYKPDLLIGLIRGNRPLPRLIDIKSIAVIKDDEEVAVYKTDEGGV